MNEVRKKFLEAVERVEEPFVLVTVVRLPTGAHEVASNQQLIQTKIDYLMTAYDDDFRLKVNPTVQVLGVILI